MLCIITLKCDLECKECRGQKPEIYTQDKVISLTRLELEKNLQRK